jgi:hypothetical protein
MTFFCVFFLEKIAKSTSNDYVDCRHYTFSLASFLAFCNFCDVLFFTKIQNSRANAKKMPRTKVKNKAKKISLGADLKQHLIWLLKSTPC